MGLKRGAGMMPAIAVLICAAVAAPPAPPYTIAPGLFDPAKPDLGLTDAPEMEHIPVFVPGPDTDKFSNGAVPVAFKGKLYVQWQSSARDEDSADTHTVYAVSSDGRHFSAPMALGTKNGGMQTSGGWWQDGDTLIAYLNVWPHGFRDASGHHPGGYTVYRTSTDGTHWSPEKPVTDAQGRTVPGIIEQDPHRYAGRIYTAFHLAPGLHVSPFYTDDPRGITGWTRGAMPALPHSGDVSRAIEPSLFRQRNGCLVMVFRDQTDSFHQLASQSCDLGAHWSLPVSTTMADTRAKQSAGNLPDGTAFLVNAPNSGKSRIPLAITLSRDGQAFTRAFRIRGRADLPVMKYPGKYKRLGYHYPKSVVWNGTLWVAYSENKERIVITRIPVSKINAPQAEYKH